MEPVKFSKNIGVIGVGTMGLNIIKNVTKKQKKIFVYNRSENNFEKIPTNVFKTTDLKEFLSVMKSGLILLFIPDNSIKSTCQQLSASISELNLQGKFVVADAGNSYFVKSMELRPFFNDIFHYVCIGTSGGAKGALTGPAMMLGCNIEYKEYLLDVLSVITPYATFVGEYFMANFIKMVHNGIEYGIMGALGEYTNLLLNSIGSTEKLIELYTRFDGLVNTYLVNCMIKILKKKIDGKNIIFDISNNMEQKGTGQWCIIESMKLDVSTPVIASAVYERLSSKDTGKFVSEPHPFNVPEKKLFLSLIIVFYTSYYEGFKLLEAKYKQDNQPFELQTFKQAWRKNCIIESKIIDTLKNATLLPNFFTFFHENYQKLMNTVISKDTLLADSLDAFAEMSTAFKGKTSAVFCSSMQYLYNDSKSSLVGRSVQGMRDVFGQHGVDLNGEHQTINWDDD
ncbi:6-phosphogluconate dehydrogenase, NADP(+)-dependent, decarboxylating [Cucumispora dikerogammari]|nr:6-phosphogluconate dehydrogenase, NADP(+)-dependent, decarboxylating [Cucumispora dikerogammari]